VNARKVGNLLILAFFGVVAFGLWMTPRGPYVQGLEIEQASFLGVDELGQDVLSRVWRGAGNSAFFGLVGSLGVMCLGAVLLIIEQSGGKAIGAVMRSLVSLGLAIPVMFFGLMLMIFMERSPWTLTLAIAVAGTPFAFRQMRVVWMEQSSSAYAVASLAIGGDWKHRLRFALWPNLKPQLFEIWKIVYAISILEISSLAFLGLAGNPNWAELGSLLRQYQKFLLQDPWLIVWPGITLCGLLFAARRLRYEYRSIE